MRNCVFCARKSVWFQTQLRESMLSKQHHHELACKLMRLRVNIKYYSPTRSTQVRTNKKKRANFLRIIKTFDGSFIRTVVGFTSLWELVRYEQFFLFAAVEFLLFASDQVFAAVQRPISGVFQFFVFHLFSCASKRKVRRFDFF